MATQIHALVKGTTKIGGYFDVSCPIGNVITYLMTDAKYDNSLREYDLYLSKDGARSLIGTLTLEDWS